MPKLIIIPLLIAVIGYFVYNQLFAKTYISSDTVIAGNYSVEKNKTVVAKNGAKLTVEGDMAIGGQFACEGGPLNLEVKGQLSVDGIINCQQGDDQFKEDQETVPGVAIVLSGSADFGKNSILASNGSIQIVDDPTLLLKTADDFAKAFDEVGEDSGDGIRIGPLVDEQNKTSAVEGASLQLVKTVEAQTPPFVKMGGVVVVGKPDKPLDKKLDLTQLSKYGKKVLVVFKLKKSIIEFPENGEMRGPKGLDGRSVKGGCAIDLSKIKPADYEAAGQGYRMRVQAKAIKVVNNYDLYLGSGGNGGNAETDKDCNPGVAIAGNGAEAANMKWTADEYIEIKGRFTLHPGKAGDGGSAIAYGKDGTVGCPGEKGGDAAAKGGNGADNIKRLTARGDVRGLSNIYIDSLLAGHAGKAEAHPGKGGAGADCDCKGGIGGKGVENFGKAGRIEQMKLPVGVQRVKDYRDYAGDVYEDRVFTADAGKDGPKCSEKSPAKITPSPKPRTDDVTSSYSDGYFEFLDIANGQPSIALSSAAKPHIIVAADPGVDVRTWLPIKLELKKDGSVIWTGTISGNPAQVCRGPTGCSTNGPSVSTDYKKLELTAYDKNGKIVATFFETYNPGN